MDLQQLAAMLQPPAPGVDPGFGDRVLLYSLLFAALLGLFPALIAHMKRRNFLLWYVYGCLFFLGAIIHVIFIPSAPAKPSGGGGGGVSPAEEIERFARLRDLGILTEAEFAAKKQQLLRTGS